MRQGKGSLWNMPPSPGWPGVTGLTSPICAYQGSECSRLRRQGVKAKKHFEGQLEKRGLGKGPWGVLGPQVPLLAQQMNESRNFPLYLPLSYTSTQLQVEAEGSGGRRPRFKGST